MSEPQTQDVNISELRAIIQGLKLSGLAYVEEDAVDEIQFLINDLPSAEELDEYAGDPAARQSIARGIGEIMRMIEVYSKRGPEYPSRFESKRKMPPRYKGVDMKLDVAAKDVSTLVRLSSVFDEKGQSGISGKLIACAKKANDGELTGEDLDDVSQTISEAGYGEGILQEAGIKNWWAGQKGGVQGLTNKVKDVYHGFADPAKASAGLARARQALLKSNTDFTNLLGILGETDQFITDQNLKSHMANIIQGVKEAQASIVKADASLNQVDLFSQQQQPQEPQQPQEAQQPQQLQEVAPTAVAGPEGFPEPPASLDLEPSQIQEMIKYIAASNMSFMRTAQAEGWMTPEVKTWLDAVRTDEAWKNALLTKLQGLQQPQAEISPEGYPEPNISLDALEVPQIDEMLQQLVAGNVSFIRVAQAAYSSLSSEVQQWLNLVKTNTEWQRALVAKLEQLKAVQQPQEAPAEAPAPAAPPAAPAVDFSGNARNIMVSDLSRALNVKPEAFASWTDEQLREKHTATVQTKAASVSVTRIV